MNEFPAEGNRSPAASPTGEPPVPPPIIDNTAADKEKKRQRRKRKCRRYLHKAPIWIEAACAILLVFITGFYTFYAARQANAAKKAAKAAYDAIEQAKLDNSASITAQQKIAQSALSDSQDNFKKSYQITVEQLRLDQRAWVAEVGIDGSPEADRPFAILVEMKNTGKTFAKNLRSAVMGDPVAKGGPPQFSKLSQIRRVGRGILAPGASRLITIYPYHGSATDKLTQAALDDLKVNKTLYVFGRIDYKDIFGCAHWTEFCMYLDPREDYKKYSACSEHNDADDNRCPDK